MTEPHGLLVWENASWTASVAAAAEDIIEGTTTLGSYVQDFDELSNGKLRYTGVCSRRFLVVLALCIDNDVAGSDLSLFIAKNDVKIADSEARFEMASDKTAAAKTEITCQAIIPLAKNEWVGAIIRLNSSGTAPDDPVAGPGTLTAWPLPEDD